LDIEAENRVSTDEEIRKIFEKETEAEERQDDPYKFGVARLPKNMKKRNNASPRQAARKRISLVYVKNPVNGIEIPEWALSFLGVNAVAQFYIGCHPWQTKPGDKADTKFFTMLAEIKVKWYSTDPLAHAKELFLHGSMPTCEHEDKLVILEPFEDFPDRGLCKACADRLDNKIRQHIVRIKDAALAGVEAAKKEDEEFGPEPGAYTWAEFYEDFPEVAAKHSVKQEAFIDLMFGRIPFLVSPRR